MVGFISPSGTATVTVDPVSWDTQISYSVVSSQTGLQNHLVSCDLMCFLIFQCRSVHMGQSTKVNLSFVTLACSEQNSWAHRLSLRLSCLIQPGAIWELGASPVTHN